MATESLKTWYVHYLHNRDIMLRKIDTITEESSTLHILYKDGTKETCMIAEHLESFESLLKDRDKTEKLSIVTLNKNTHIKVLLNEWDALSPYRGLTLTFANPDSSTDKRWIVKPYVHNSITERTALKTGIESIASNVDIC